VQKTAIPAGSITCDLVVAPKAWRQTKPKAGEREFVYPKWQKYMPKQPYPDTLEVHFAL
jgi:hypothetical protein